MNNCLKIELYNGAAYATTIYFQENELRELDVIPLIDLEQIQPTGNIYPLLHDLDRINEDASRDRYQINITFRIHKRATKTDVDSILANTYKFKIYYEYLINNATYLECLLDPQYEEIYHYGMEAYDHLMKLTFYGQVR